MEHIRDPKSMQPTRWSILCCRNITGRPERSAGHSQCTQYLS
jgi:hypothetical protein